MTGNREDKDMERKIRDLARKGYKTSFYPDKDDTVWCVIDNYSGNSTNWSVSQSFSDPSQALYRAIERLDGNAEDLNHE